MQILLLLEELIRLQTAKVLRIARAINPRITEDDILNPFDWPEVNENHQFTWEAGILGGYQSAKAAIEARLGELRAEARRRAGEHDHDGPA